METNYIIERCIANWNDALTVISLRNLRLPDPPTLWPLSLTETFQYYFDYDEIEVVTFLRYVILFDAPEISYPLF